MRVLKKGLVLGVLGCGLALGAWAAPLNLSQVPLFLGFRVEPNILFVVDDSGSMDWEVMTKDAANDGLFTGSQPDGSNPPGAGSVKHRDSDDDGDADCTFSSGTFYGYLYIVEFGENTYPDDGRDCNTADDQTWRIRNHDFNPLYFDPNKTYKPWPGVDAAGVPFQNMPITAARANPYDPTSETIDLTRHNSNWLGGRHRDTSDRDGDGLPDGFRYYTWTDRNGNGLFDNGEETEHLIKDADPATQQNFANWFSYYRKREYVAKAAFAKIIAEATNVRMGLVTLHNNNAGGQAKTPIRSMNADPTTGNKRALLDALYSIESSGNTPLRVTLDNAGRYFECRPNNYFPECPVLPAEEGGACQQNFIVFMTDGFYNGNSPHVGNTDGPGSGNTPWDGGAYADDRSDTLADVAMYYYERDLHPELADTVPITPGVDEATHQHVVTYTVAFGLKGTLEGPPPNPNDPFPWPNPFASDAARIDDLLHAAYNARGEYLNAANPDELAEALQRAIQSIAERTSSAASVALNAGTHSTESRLYQARFNSGDWSGQLLSLPIDEHGVVQSPEWDAGAVLDTQNYDAGRVILTYNPLTRRGVPFRWRDLAPTQQLQLHTDASGNNDGQGEARLEYLRGSKEHEGQGNRYRVRRHLLGDLVHSDPYFVGAPSFPDALGEGYAAFRSAYARRAPVVYVGGNDGMLHGFSAASGREVLAYVPNLVFPHLSKLTAPNYAHRYFVDGSPTAGDAFLDVNGDGRKEWRTILVSGLRGGGQGFFALDVTDPSRFAESNAARLVLWEFSDADDPDLGYSFSQPSIVRMANGKWAAVVGNGYNNTEADGHPSLTGHAVLYILFLEGGLDGIWTPGVDFIKIDTRVGDPDTPNGLATPAPVDVDGDFTADYIYAGDLRGNLWKFDVRDPNPRNWKVAYFQGVNPKPLFTATDARGTPQPITSRPEAGHHPKDPNGVLVYFGTGKYLEVGDNSVAGVPTQTFYAIWDKNEDTLSTIRRRDLLAQTVLKEVNGRRITSDNPIDWSQHLGWYLDLPTQGERQVTDSVLRNNRIIFTTLIPDPQVCSFGGGGWLMELDALSGSRLSESPFDLDEDHDIDADDLVTVRIDGQELTVAVSGVISTEGILPTPTVLSSGTTELKYSSGSTGGIFTTTENPGPGAIGRQAWRQLQ